MLNLRQREALHPNPKEEFVTVLGDSIDDNEQIDVLERLAKTWLIRDGIQILPDVVNSLQQWQVRRAVLKNSVQFSNVN